MYNMALAFLSQEKVDNIFGDWGWEVGGGGRAIKEG